MKVLVTGGGGFVGAYIVEDLLRADVGTRVYDICQGETGAFSPHLEYIHGDIFDLECLHRAFQGIDCVIHLVGVGDAHLAESDPGRSFRLNVLSLLNVLEACRIHQTRRLLFPSSAAVYGRTEKIPVSEHAPIRPTGAYGRQKWLCEQLIRAYGHAFGVRYTILRLFNAFGKGNKNILHHCVRAAKEGRPIEVFGIDQLRDFIFIGDVARAFRLAALSHRLDDQTINVGTGRGWKIRSVVEIVQRLFPHLEVRFVEKEDFLPYDSVADGTRMRSLLGFTAGVCEASFEQAIREIARDVEDHIPSLVGR